MILTLKNITVKIGKKVILDKVSCEFENGKIYAVMGPNGSGKSTLASVVAGHPGYEITSGKILYQGTDISELVPEKRVHAGIFMTFQSPIALTGVTIYQLMRYALNGKKDPLTIRKEVQKFAKVLKIPEKLLDRSLNEGFSGGERKKMEVLQAAIINPNLIFFDEIDTGVDVDALKTIANFIKKLHTPDKTFILITHYNRLLKYLAPDKVLVLKDGKIVKSGSAKLADTIEKSGYDKI